MSTKLRGLLLLLTAFALTACAGMQARKGNGDASFGIVTFNLYHDKADWPERRALILGELRTLQPDVIVLQEVLQHETLRNQAEDLAEALGYSAYFSTIDPADRTRRYGNAILTRHPVLARDWTALRPLADSRNAGFVRIDMDGHPLNVYVTHPNYQNDDAGRQMRQQQLADVLDFVQRTAGSAPSIIAGDLNAVSGQPELAALEAGFDNAFDALHGHADPQPTLNQHYFPADGRRIDHVYLRRDALKPLQARIILNREGAPGVWPSDHFGLYVRFAFVPPR